MSQTTKSLYGELMDSLLACLTPEVAEKIAAIRASAKLQERLEVLADRNTQGQLTYEENLEYEGYIHLFEFLAILQAQSRKIVGEVAAR